ncbi:MAG: LEA type 2 family protein [Nitrososphaeria archaeon]
MSKKFAAITIVTILTLIFASIFYYEYVKREALRACEISLADVRVKSVGLTSASLEIVFRIYNPNRVTATLDRADYSVYANGIYLGEGHITGKVDVPANNTVTIVSPFDLSYSGALKTVWPYLMSGGKLLWRINGTLHIDTPLGTLDIPFDTTVS